MRCRLVKLDRDTHAVLLEDEDGVGRGEGHLGGNHRPDVVRQAVESHDPVERDGEERCRDHVGQERRVAHQPAVADAHAADGEARERADRQRQNHGRYADVEAVAELLPEILEVPVALGDHDPEALERRLRWKHLVGEHVAPRFERHGDDVVDRGERPDEHRDAESERRRLAELAPQPVVRPPRRPAVDGERAHKCTSVVCSLRMRRITSGIISGSADITTATPRSGRAISKASRMPSVASTWVDSAGPPPETK